MHSVPGIFSKAGRLAAGGAFLWTLAGCAGIQPQTRTAFGPEAHAGLYPVCTRARPTRLRSLAEDDSARCRYSTLAGIR